MLKHIVYSIDPSTQSSLFNIANTTFRVPGGGRETCHSNHTACKQMRIRILAHSLAIESCMLCFHCFNAFQLSVQHCHVHGGVYKNDGLTPQS